MGTYRSPEIIKNSQGLQTMNEQLAKFNETMGAEYDGLIKAQNNRKAENDKLQAKIQESKMKDYDEFNLAIQKSGLDLTDSSIIEVVQQLRDEYKNIAGSSDPKDKDYLTYLKMMPQQIKAGGDIGNLLSGDFEKALGFEIGTPNSIDLDQIDPSILALAIDKKFNGQRNTKLTIDRDKNSPDYGKAFWTVDRAALFGGGNMGNNFQDNYEVDIDGSGTIDDWEKKFTSGELGDKNYRISNSGLINKFGDPKNRPKFFPTLSDMNNITSIVMEGDKKAGIPGLNEIFKKSTELFIEDRNGEKRDITYESYTESRKALAQNLADYPYTNSLNNKEYSTGAWSQSLTYALNGLEQANDKLRAVPPVELNAVDLKLLKAFYGDDMVYQPNAQVKDPIDQFKEGGTTGFGPYIGYINNTNTQNNNKIQWQREVMGLGHSQMILDNPIYNKQDVEIKNIPHKAKSTASYRSGGGGSQNTQVWQNAYNSNYYVAQDYYDATQGKHKAGDNVSDLVTLLNTKIPGGKTGYHVGSNLLLAPGGGKTIQEIAALKAQGKPVGKYFTKAATEKYGFSSMDEAITWALGDGSITVYNTNAPQSLKDGIIDPSNYNTPEALAMLMTDAEKITGTQRKHLVAPQGKYHAYVQSEIRNYIKTLTGTTQEKQQKLKAYKQANCLFDYNTTQGKKCFAKWEKTQ